MPLSIATEGARRSEAERLIALARALLTDKSEELAVIYLDQAVEALRAVSDEAETEAVRSALLEESVRPAKAPRPNRD